DEINEKAVEVALQTKESGGGAEITAVTMGPKNALDAIRKALAMGADAGIHIIDDALGGSDALQTSAALAAALGSRGFDLVIAGNESTDGRTAAIPAMLAERLGMAQATFLRTLKVSDGTVSGERMTEDGHVEISAALPAVVSVTEQIADARFPNFKGIMAAKKKPVETWSLADLGVDPSLVGLGAAWTSVVSFAQRPPRQQGQLVKDEGDGGTKLAEFLVSQKFI
ncbi:MAG: electron transfer flavoprotein subunit beta/FixA family protein, partial [Ornithinibacter sp.]